jgi:hypothetical protein
MFALCQWPVLASPLLKTDFIRDLSLCKADGSPPPELRLADLAIPAATETTPDFAHHSPQRRPNVLGA